jgi:pyrroline-5-carboxylate reductase
MKVGIIGAGVMAEAMIAGLLAEQVVASSALVASHPRAERRTLLAERHAIRVVERNAEAVAEADIVVLAVKPQMLGRVMRELAPSLGPEQVVLSIVAGATLRALASGLGHGAVVRAMPNTPAQIRRGITVWAASPACTPSQRELAHDLVAATLLGSAEFASRSDLHPAQLRNAVTSPGGTSAAAIYELEKGRLRTVLSDAVWAAYRRTQELGERLERETGNG